MKYPNDNQSSAKYLLECLSKCEAERVNIHHIDFDSGELKHFFPAGVNPVRNKYVSIYNLKKLVSSSAFINSTNTIVISTTHKVNDTFKSFIGLDVEYVDKRLGLKVCTKVKELINEPFDLIKTTSGYHIFLPTVIYGSDIELWSAISKIIKFTSLYLNHSWVHRYVEFIESAKNFEDIKKVANLILSEVGHINSKDSRPFTFIDLRHLAQAVLSNDRKRGELTLGKEDGVRTQLFFRISNKTKFDCPPYLIQRF